MNSKGQFKVDICTCQIFQAQAQPTCQQSRPAPARSKYKNFGPSTAWPKTKYKILAQSRPGQFVFSDFGPDCLGISDFKTDLFSCLHIINFFFGLAHWKIHFSFCPSDPAQPVWKITSRFPARWKVSLLIFWFGPLEKSTLIWSVPGQTHDHTDL